jgi:hypothetical protein
VKEVFNSGYLWRAEKWDFPFNYPSLLLDFVHVAFILFLSEER